MTLLVFYLLLAIGVSFLCSILEAVLLSVTPSYVAMLERSGDKTGILLRSLKEDIDKPLSAILSLNTIAHTVGAAGVGAQAQMVFGNAYVTITSAILTLLILVFSEIIPKTLGANYWRGLSGFSARATRILIVVSYPLVLLSKGITRWLSNDEYQPSVSRDEFSALADRGVEEGVFEEGESNVFKNLIRFGSLRVKDVMTPRPVVVRFHKGQTIQKALEDWDEEELHFSRLPIYDQNEDDITGYVLKVDMLRCLSKNEGEKTLREIKRDILIVPEIVSLKVLMERLFENQEHIAAAVDEYGGFSGVVTMEDVVETLFGIEIVDEIDTIEDMQKLARQKWRERAKRLGIVLPELQAEQETQTDEDDE